MSLYGLYQNFGGNAIKVSQSFIQHDPVSPDEKYLLLKEFLGDKLFNSFAHILSTLASSSTLNLTPRPFDPLILYNATGLTTTISRAVLAPVFLMEWGKEASK